MKHRKLRIAFSVTCGIACVLLVVLWVRSYWWADSLQVPTFGPRVRYFYIYSTEGLLHTNAQLDSAVIPGLRLQSRSITKPHQFIDDFSPFRKCLWPRKVTWQGLTTVYVPYWIPLLATTALVLVALLPYRFSLRTLLIATTLIAVVLGLVVYAGRG